MENESSLPLPEFRKDLRLFHGPQDKSGYPTYSLYDPIKAKYYQLNWLEFHIFKNWRKGITAENLIQEVKATSTVVLEIDEVEEFFEMAFRLGLLNLPKPSEQLLREKESKKEGLFKWLLFNYLYLRIPLLHPDNFLSKTLPFVMPLVSKQALITYAAITCVGLLLILTMFDEYLYTFTYFFNFEGFVAYTCAVSAVKVIHEFSHAYTAKYYKVHVPTMGIALIVLWPVLYTDVTDAWKLSKRKQRLAISLAGVISELIIAGLATLGWALTSPGILHSIFFILSSASWITSLFVNLNPAMRFDGYYILTDLWGIDNLRARAFAVGRWKMHEWLFKFNRPCPEEHLDPGTIRGMWIYSYFTWIYLFILYTAIALFVYTAFTKALGVLLFAVEIAVFFIWPVYWEVQELYRLRSYFTVNLRSAVTALVMLAFALWFFLPWPHVEQFNAVTAPEKLQVLYAPMEAKIETIFATLHQSTSKGQKILQLSNAKLDTEIAKTSQDLEILQRQIEILSLEADTLNQLAPLQAQLNVSLEKMQELQGKKKRLTLAALINGSLYYWDEKLKVGDSVEKNQVFGKIANLAKMDVITLVPEQFSRNLAIGKQASFRPAGAFTTYSATIKEISPFATTEVNYPILSATYKGPLAVVQEGNEKHFKESYFEVRLELSGNSNLAFGQTGYTEIQSEPYSLFMWLLKYLYTSLLRESSL